ncbi:type IV pilin-like G/H family protein [Trichormus variabilis]|uniref:Pili assembly chaperone n=1 Tax=Trichormus variabilis SAG 1403-4b TaxID=447716 RepID=A0A433UTZ6_ANAVA|nr:type IV pilin-like G/H family protein [Trichormus variabilis]MBD2627877.1 type IV pilin-like G/H family protein [Trichormus variabilis FACHB-164]RUS97257.1 pili assembly chaperone [Trichormus variabilis SAG 1403-4b]
MKTELKAKFIQHLLGKKKENEGFTLIELLVVIIIIGILSAIALPSFLNQANKARESEAKQYVGSMNRAQQAYYLEKQSFSSLIGDLGLGIQSNTTNYEYTITADAANNVANIADPKNSQNLRAYVGAVDLINSGGAATTLAILCQKDNAGAGSAASVTLNDDLATQPACAAGFKTID